MTRINAGVNPLWLVRQHLLAEHREMVRVPRKVASGTARLDLPIPEKFCLGRGHVRFFYDKLGYLKTRYLSVRDECWRRGYQVTDFATSWDGVPPSLMNDWSPDQTVVEIITERINQRLDLMGLPEHKL